MSKIINNFKNFFLFRLAKIDKSEIILYNDSEKIKLQQLIETREVLQNRLNQIDAEIDDIIVNAKRLYRGG